MRFETTVVLGGRTATGFEVPADVVHALAAGRRPAVTATVNGYSYRSTVAVMGGVFMLPLAAEHRSAAGVSAGDVVAVDLELDRHPREVVVPADLQAALAAAGVDAETFAALSYTRRKEMVRSVEDAKTDSTRQRRIAKAVDRVREGGDRP